MNGMNKIILVGRLGRDPELRESRGGTPWCTLSVATSRPRKQDGVWTEETDWHRVKAFGRQAEICHQYLRKGSVVAVEGSLAYSKSEYDGETRYWADVLADRVQFVGSPTAARAES